MRSSILAAAGWLTGTKKQTNFDGCVRVSAQKGDDARQSCDIMRERENTRVSCAVCVCERAGGKCLGGWGERVDDLMVEYTIVRMLNFPWGFNVSWCFE